MLTDLSFPSCTSVTKCPRPFVRASVEVKDAFNMLRHCTGETKHGKRRNCVTIVITQKLKKFENGFYIGITITYLINTNVDNLFLQVIKRSSKMVD